MPKPDPLPPGDSRPGRKLVDGWIPDDKRAKFLEQWLTDAAPGKWRRELMPDVAPPLEKATCRQLPQLYWALITGFRFQTFEWHGVDFYGTEKSEEDFEYDPLPYAALRDKGFNEVLVCRGCLPIGRPKGGGYDPICLLHDAKSGRWRVVRIEHEEALIGFRLVVNEEIARSFEEFVGFKQ